MRNLLGRGLVCVLIFFGAPSLAMQDFLKFLHANRWEVQEKPPGFDKQLADFLDSENYFVRDEFGNEYLLWMLERTEILRILATHELAEVIGLDHVPVYPVIVRRGENGIPTMAELESGQAVKKLFDPDDPDDKAYSRHIGDIAYTSALLFPRLTLEPLRDPKTAKEIAAHLKQILFRMAIGASILHFGSLSDHRQRYLVADGILSLPYETKWQEFKSEFGAIDYRALQALNKQDAQKVVDEIADYLDRLEWVGKNHLDSIFEPSIAFLGEERDFKVLVIPALKRKIKTLRGFTERAFRERIGGHFRLDLKTRPLPYEVLYTPPRIGRIRWIQDMSKVQLPENQWERRANARNLLEAFYLSTTRRQADMVKVWGATLNKDNPIDFLLNEAREWDGTVRIDNSRAPSSRDPLFTPVNLERQVFLNRNLPKTMVVFGQNDMESNEVLRVLTEVKGQIPYYPQTFSLRAGQRIGRGRLNFVYRRAIDEGFKHIIFGEIRGVEPDQRARFKAAGIEIEFFDHHEEEGETKWHPYSFLEQICDRINYQQELTQKLIGMTDRSGLHAFRQVNWSLVTVNEYMSRYRQDLLELRKPISGAFDAKDKQVVLLMDNADNRTSFSELSYAFNWEVYPRVANALVARKRSLLFFGKAEFTMQVYDYLKSEEKHVSVFWAGDIGSTTFLTARLNDDFENIELLAHRVRLQIKNKKILSESCAVEVSKAIWNSASDQTVPSSRSSSQK